MHPVLFLALNSYTGTAHLAHSEVVVCLSAPNLLNTLALCLRVGLGTYDKGLDCGVARVDALFQECGGQTCGIAGYTVKSGGSEVRDELNVTLAVSCAGGNCQCTQTLGSILYAQTSGKHSVA